MNWALGGWALLATQTHRGTSVGVLEGGVGNWTFLPSLALVIQFGLLYPAPNAAMVNPPRGELLSLCRYFIARSNVFDFGFQRAKLSGMYCYCRKLGEEKSAAPVTHCDQRCRGGVRVCFCPFSRCLTAHIWTFWLRPLSYPRWKKNRAGFWQDFFYFLFLFCWI